MNPARMEAREFSIGGIRFSGARLGDSPVARRAQDFDAWEHDATTSIEVALARDFVSPTLQLRALGTTLSGLPREIYLQALKPVGQGGEGWLLKAEEADQELRALRERASGPPPDAAMPEEATAQEEWQRAHLEHALAVETWKQYRHIRADIIPDVIAHLRKALCVSGAENSRNLALWKLDPSDWAGSAARLQIANKASGSLQTEVALATRYLMAMREDGRTRVMEALRQKGIPLAKATLSDIAGHLLAEEDDRATLRANAPELVAASSRYEATVQPKPRYARVAAQFASGSSSGPLGAQHTTRQGCRICMQRNHDEAVCFLRSEAAFAAAPEWVRAMGETLEQALAARLSQARDRAQGQRGHGRYDSTAGRGANGRGPAENRYGGGGGGRGGRRGPMPALPPPQLPRGARAAAAASGTSGIEALAEQIAALAARVSDMSDRIPGGSTTSVSWHEA